MDISHHVKLIESNANRQYPSELSALQDDDHAMSGHATSAACRATEEDVLAAAVQNTIVRVIARNGYEGEDTKDLAQEVNLVMFLRTRTDDLKRAVLPKFAATTARLVSWDLRRSAWSRRITLNLEGRDLDLEAQSDYSDPERRLFGLEVVTLVNSAISKLSRRRRQVAQCILFDELSIEETAGCLGISKRAVSTHLCNAKTEIAIALRAAGYAIRGSGTTTPASDHPS